MGIGNIGGMTYTPYSTALNSGPTAAPRTDEAETAAKANEEQQRALAEQLEPSSAGSTTPTRGQNLNITV